MNHEQFKRLEEHCKDMSPEEETAFMFKFICFSIFMDFLPVIILSILFVIGCVTFSWLGWIK